MRKAKTVNRIAGLFALFIILFQTFAFPVAAAKPWEGKSWEGKSWEGNSWEGNSWEGNSWEGSSWEGDSWEGNSWEGDSWTGDPWEGSSWEGKTWNGSSWEQAPGPGGNGWNGSEWNGSDFNGDSWTQNPGPGGDGWNGSDFNGNQWNGSDHSGNPWEGNGHNGNPWDGSSYNGDPWNTPGYNGNPWDVPGLNGFPGYNGSNWSPSGSGGGGGAGAFSEDEGPTVYDVTKFIADDYIGGKISMIDAYTNGGSTSFGPTSSYLTSLALSGVKMGMGERTPWYINAADDATSIYDMGKGVYDAGKTIRDIRSLETVGDVVTRGATTVSPVASISKLSAVGAGISAGFSAYDTVMNTKNAVDVWKSDASTSKKVAATADATGSFGETMFNVGVVASAIPGGQAVGAGLMVAGGVVWGASKVTKFFADGTAKKVWNTTKDTAKKVWKNTTGFFKGLFGK